MLYFSKGQGPQQPLLPQQIAGNDDEWTYEQTSGNSSGDVNDDQTVGRMSAGSHHGR
jgi:hypothetical protein